MSKDKKNQQSSRRKLEAGLDSAAGTLFNSDGFAKTAGLATNVTARVQKSVSDRMARNLGLMNMPSRDDLTAIGERLIAIENRLMHIEDMLMRMAPRDPDARPVGPPRTRKPAKTAAKPAKTAKTTKSTKQTKSKTTTKRKSASKS